MPFLEISSEPAFFIVALIAVVLTGLSKSGLGGGLGQLSVPFMALYISPVAAAAIMLPILCIIDLVNVWRYRKDFSLGNVAVMVPGAVIGIAIGAMTFSYVDDNMIRLLLGGITVFFALTYFVQSAPVSADSNKGKIVGTLCGMMSGFTSFIAHAGGGPVKMFLLPQRMSPRTLIATQCYFFFMINQLKIWPYFWLGQFSQVNLTTSLLLLPAVPIGVWLGWKIVDVIKVELFYKICYGVLFIAGVKLIHDGLTRGGYI